MRLLAEVLDSGTLFAPKGRMVKRLEADFARFVGSEYAVASASGTAAVHTALAAIDPEPGDEVITTAITDMGALSPILYQAAIPVFADVDPDSGNVTADTVAARLTDRTRAIIATHLFGNPADVEAIARVARSAGVPLIEDSAQAFGAMVGDRHVGTIGEIGTFSLQQGKHITTGEGGLTVTSDAATARRARLYVNKAWDYDTPGDHDFLALNYRMSELIGAVGVAQLAKLADGVEARRKAAAALDAALAPIDGIRPTPAVIGTTPSYWRYGLLVDPNVVPGGPAALAGQLRELGIPSAPRYIQKPAFRCGIFRDQKTFGQSRFPFTLASAEAVDYSEERFPGTFSFLERILVLPWNEKYDEGVVATLATAIRHGVERLTEGES
ncbi:MAG TPA: DegT/DnrJ/EryC1/StrS family aminotransferase [Acidimicrobiia bacterium]